MTGLLPSATSLTPILLRETGQVHASTCSDHGLEGSSLRLSINSPVSLWIPLEEDPSILPYDPGTSTECAFPVCGGCWSAVRTGLRVARTMDSSSLPEGRCSGEAGGALQEGPRSTF